LQLARNLIVIEKEHLDYRSTSTTGAPRLQKHLDYRSTSTTGAPRLQEHLDYKKPPGSTVLLGIAIIFALLYYFTVMFLQCQINYYYYIASEIFWLFL